MALDVVTFGCRLNALESEAMRRAAAAAGIGDALLVNTCAVTGEAVRQARQAIRRAGREQPGRPVVVAGCAAQIDPAAFAAMPEVTRVLGNREKRDPAAYDLARPGAPRLRVGDIFAPGGASAPIAATIEGHTRAFVEIQNGCDHRCTFCIIPYGRGASHSLPPASVLAAVRVLVDGGHAEVVLTGVDITAWGADLAGSPALGQLVRQILRAVPALKRLRLSSLDSVEVDGELLRAFAEDERLMPHLHLSLQHGDDLILKRMQRRHRRADAVRFAATVRRLRPDVVFGADIIAGFPTEDAAAFERSLALIDDCGLTHLHVFPFSPRPGTPAARMPQLDGALVRERAARLRRQGERALLAHLDAEVGRRRTLLIERGGIGRTEQFTAAMIAGQTPGTIVAARIVGRTARALVAEAA